MDVVLTNGRLLTMDGDEGIATALAISAGRIAAIGSDDQIGGLGGAGCRRINLRGRTLLPGFHDCHCHMLGVGLALAQIDVSPALAGDIPALEARLREQSPPGDGWILGSGYDQNRMAERRHPTRFDLDRVSADRPVAITHTSGHAIAANSAALRLARIDRNTADPQGGVIERDRATGEATGVLFENALELIYQAQPTVSTGQQVSALGLASKHMAQMGITSASEASAEPSDLAAFLRAAEQRTLTIRCHPFLMAHQLKDARRFLTPADISAQTHPLVSLGIAKIFTDGALTTRTASLREPYIDKLESCGTLIWERKELTRLVQGAHDAGWQIAAHAIGDAAIDQCLDAFQKAVFHSPGLSARHRIEHAMLMWDDQIGRLTSQGVVAVFQPEFIARLGDAYLAALGSRRANRLMPYRAIVQAGGHPLAFSSDMPVVPGKPLDGVRAAVERKAPSGMTIGVGERVTPYEALRAYTYGAAFAARCEKERGRLAEGLLADIAVLSEDPTRIATDEWDERVRVELAAVAGEPVYGSWDGLQDSST